MKALDLPPAIREEIISQAQAELPNECCGLLAGRGAHILERIPLVNALASPIAYAAEIRGLFEAFRKLRDVNLDLLAIYHSHPTSPAVPSRTDLEQWHYTNAMMVIVSLENEAVVRGWRVGGDSVFEEDLIV